MGITFSDINHTNVSLGQGLPRQQIITKVKINKWGLVKHTSFCTAKEIINKANRQPVD